VSAGIDEALVAGSRLMDGIASPGSVTVSEAGALLSSIAEGQFERGRERFAGDVLSVITEQRQAGADPAMAPQSVGEMAVLVLELSMPAAVNEMAGGEGPV
jgi:hypothetical protein